MSCCSLRITTFLEFKSSEMRFSNFTQWPAAKGTSTTGLIGIIQNPSKKEQIVIFRTGDVNNVCMYDTNKLEYNSVDPSCTNFNFDFYNSSQLSWMSVLRGFKQDSIIVLGARENSCNTAFYGVFNTKSESWQGMNDQANLLFSSKTDSELRNFGHLNVEGTECVIDNELLFVSAGYPYSNVLSVFKLDQFTQYPKALLHTIQLPYRFSEHLITMIPTFDNKVRTKSILLFGENECVCHINKVYDENNNEIMEFECVSNNISHIIDTKHKPDSIVGMSKWVTKLVDSRYLVILGGRDEDIFADYMGFGRYDKHRAKQLVQEMVNKDLVVWDFKNLQWYTFDIQNELTSCWRSYDEICANSDQNDPNIDYHWSNIYGNWIISLTHGMSLFRNNKSDMCLYLFATKSQYWKKNIVLTLNYSMGWNHERLIWIGFYKNKSNHKCLVQCLPKDVVFYMLEFLRCNPFCE